MCSAQGLDHHHKLLHDGQVNKFGFAYKPQNAPAQTKNAAPTLTIHMAQPICQTNITRTKSTVQALKCCQGQSNAIPVWIFLPPSGSNKAHPGATAQGCLPVLPDSQTARVPAFVLLGHSDKPEATRLPRDSFAQRQS